MLNLDNMDSAEAWAWDCPLVLTSPRSLAACRLVGVKPVELLSTDIMELSETLGSSDLARLADLRDLVEHRRLTNLEHCRAIRRYLISQHVIDEHHLLTAHKYNGGALLLENASPVPPPSARPSLHDQNISFRKRENIVVAEQKKAKFPSIKTSSSVQPVLCCSAKPLPRYGKRYETVLSDKATLSPELSTLSTDLPRQIIGMGSRASSNNGRISQISKKSAPWKNSSETEDNNNNIDETSCQSANICKPVRTATTPSQRRQRQQATKRRRLSQRRQQRRQSPAPPTTPSLVPTPSASASTSVFGGANKSSSEVVGGGSRECFSHQIRRTTLQYFKLANLGAQWRRTAEAVGLSEQDHKILLLLERKALEKRASEMSSETARIVWEREAEQRTKRLQWEKERRKQEIAERRKEDQAETKRRLASLERNLNRAQRRLADTLRRRDEEAQQRLLQIAHQKDALRAERKAADLARQAAVEKRLRHLNEEFKRHENYEAEARMRNSEGPQREWYSSPVIKTTSTSLLVLPSNPKQCTSILRKRPSSAPGPTSATTDPRILSARMIRDAIERNLAASRVCAVAQSEACGRAAASRASARIKARSTHARITSTRRRVAHLASAARLRALHGAAVARLRTRIRAGERKIATLLAAKERSVAGSRAAAAVAAHLRSNLRGTLSPTTFDRMAAHVATHRLRTAGSPSLTHSHILKPG